MPSAETVARSQLTAFAQSLATSTGLELRNPARLHEFSVTRFRDFWRHLLDWAELCHEGDATRVCVGDLCETATFFPDLRLSYAENLLDGRASPQNAPAITSCRSDGARVRLTRAELRERVERFAEALREHGIGVGDRVVAIMRNDADAVVAALAVSAVGASLAAAAPDMGAEAILERFAPLAPRLLIAHVGALPHDTGAPVAARVAQVAAALSSLMLLVKLDDAPLQLTEDLPVHTLSELLARYRVGEFHWQRFEFNQPLFVLASSGTTGRPKCIVHGAGGSLLEHVKEHRLHCDLRPSDKLFFQTSCAWMMWQWQLSALASGCEIVLYDGPIRDAGTLWRIVQDEQVTVFGTSPPYLKLGEDAGLAPGREFDLGALRALLCTGSILYEHAYTWVRDHVKAVPLQSVSGGTDILGCFVLGNPNLPVHAGECQCRSLGLDVQAAQLADRLAGAAPIGELICANPFPSRPLGFYGDVDGTRFHASYFARNPGVWTHGDLIELTPEGTARMHGRTDGVMNVRGIRVGPAEVYRVLREFEQIREAMVVEQHAPAAFSEGRAVLLLVLRDGVSLDAALTARLRRRLAEAASAAHVPDVVLQVAELPCTHSGKPSEAAMTDAVNGLPVRNLEALRNPGCLDAIRDAPALRAPAAPPPGESRGQDTESWLQSLWETMFGFSPIGPHDDFFALGGHSLLAARMLAEVQRATGRQLALTSLLQTPTIHQLAGKIDAADPAASARLVQLRPGTGRPFFLVHSMAGTFLELWAVLRVLDTRRPVYGLQARGLEPGQEPHLRVSDMAADYIGHMRSVQAKGPYALGGYSFGGLVAFDIAQQLLRSGEQVELLSLIDTQVHGRYLPLRQWLRHRVRRLVGALRFVGTLPNEVRLAYLQDKSMVLIDRIRAGFGLTPKRPDLVGDVVGEANFPLPLRRVRGAMLLAMRDYRPQPYPGKVVFLRAAVSGDSDPLPVWRKVVRGGLDVSVTPGNHDEMISERNAKALAVALARHL
jgi:acetoacetyl-CoA synthetase